MYVVRFPCQQCAVEATLLTSKGHIFCLNCLIVRRSPGALTRAGGVGMRSMSSPTAATS
jgi:hypothetical protein